MRKLIEMKTVAKDAHHMYTYEDGKKTPIPDDGVVFAYLAPETEKGRMLKVTEYPDRAGSIDGKFVVTDELKQIMGKPAVDNVPYDIWGIGEDYVIVSARGDKFYIGSSNPKKITTQPNQSKKLKVYKLLHEIYSMLI